MTRVEKSDDGCGIDELARCFINQGLDNSWWWPRRRKVVTAAKEIELGFQKERDVAVGFVLFIQIELLGEGGQSSFGVEEFPKYALGTAGDEDTKGKRRI